MSKFEMQQRNKKYVTACVFCKPVSTVYILCWFFQIRHWTISL